jgi:hypothetical protein
MIEKLSEVKSLDNKKTLLMYIIEKMEAEKGTDIFDPNENLDDVDLLAKTPLS